MDIWIPKMPKQVEIDKTKYEQSKAYVFEKDIKTREWYKLEPYGATVEYLGLNEDGTGYARVYLCNENCKDVPFDEKQDRWENKGYVYLKKIDVTKLSPLEYN